MTTPTTAPTWTISSPTYTGSDAYDTTDVDAEIERLAAHWESMGEDAADLRSATQQGDEWITGSGEVIACRLTACRLTATRNTGGWIVSDPDGGVWHPSDEAAGVIEAAASPASAAIQICIAEPMRGKWHS